MEGVSFIGRRDGSVVQVSSLCFTHLFHECLSLLEKWFNKVTSLISIFLVGDTKRDNKIHWKRQDSLTASKLEGGLFKYLLSFNLSLLGKQAWRILQNQDLLCAQLLKSVYYPNDMFLNAKKGGRESWFWQSLLASRDAFSRELIWIIGRGDEVLF